MYLKYENDMSLQIMLKNIDKQYLTKNYVLKFSFNKVEWLIGQCNLTKNEITTTASVYILQLPVGFNNADATIYWTQITSKFMKTVMTAKFRELDKHFHGLLFQLLPSIHATYVS